MKNQPHPIAIVGMACRFPGGCDTPDKFWEFLSSGTDIISEIHPDRWSSDYYFHPDAKTSGKTYTKAAGQLDNIYHFDPGFFGITPREAAQMDPQQRLLLQMSWEALEDGGQLPSRLAGSDCSVFVGISSLDYANNRMDDPNVADAYFMTGNTLSIAANRLSYIYDLRGPSMAIDTACSSSLVALHQACSSIWSGESESSIVGAVHLVLSPFPFIGFSKANMLSADGRCKVFDADADGYVRSEGGVVFFLKPLEQARQDGDPVHAVIRGTAVNSDGNKSALTVPNGEAQTRLLKDVYTRAGIDLKDVSYIEAHGTGTPVGDPIEAQAIGNAFANSRNENEPLIIGSVKSNIGHLEPASGFAGLLKVILSLKHRTVPATIHQHRENPNIDFKGLNLSIAKENTSFDLADNKSLIMGVNSFGFGGTNAHAILEEYSSQASHNSGFINGNVPPLYLSAENEESLRRRAGQFRDLLNQEHSEGAIYDIFYNAAIRRQRQKHSLVAYGETLHEIRESLDKFARGKSAGNLVRTDSVASGKVAFVFSGNGSQWPGMGQQLIQLPVFRDTIDLIDSEFEPLSGWSIRDAMLKEDPGLEYTEVAQPLLFALQVGIVALLKDMGISADAVAGHSVGEIAAAYTSGALNLTDAVRVIYFRSYAQSKTKGQGRMAAVKLSPEEIQQRLQVYSGKIEIAAINSDNSVTISGDQACIHKLLHELRDDSISCRELDIDYAFHNRVLDDVHDYIIEHLQGLHTQDTQIEFVSTVTGQSCQGTQLDARYWWDNIRQPVQFAAAISHFLDNDVRHFIEIGPHPVLQSYIRDMLRSSSINGSFVKTLARNERNEYQALLGTRYRSIFSHDRYSTDGIFPIAGNHITLPPYPWNNAEYIFTSSIEAINKNKDHTLLGYRVHSVEGVWINQIDTELYPFLADHVVDGLTVFPAAAYAEMALAASALWSGKAGVAISSLEIRKPLILEPGKTKTLLFMLSGKDQHFTIKSRDRLSSDPWVDHVTGKVSNVYLDHDHKDLQLERLEEGQETIIARDDIYRNAALCGLRYGESFQGVRRVMIGEDASVITEIEEPDGQGDTGYLLNPVIMDSAFHTLFSLIQDDDLSTGRHTYVPVEFGSIQVCGIPGSKIYSECILHTMTPNLIRASFDLYDAKGQHVAEINDCLFRKLPRVETHKHAPSFYRYSEFPKNLINSQDATPLLSNSELLTAVKAISVNEDALKSEILVSEQVIPLFDALASAIAETTFREFGAHLGSFTVDSLISTSMITADYKPYLAYLLNILEQDGKAHHDGGHWQMIDSDDVDDPVEIWRSILADYPQYVGLLRDTANRGLRSVEILSSLRNIEKEADSMLTRPTGMAQSALQEYILQLILKQITTQWPDKRRRLRIAEIRDHRYHTSMDIISLLPAQYCDYEILAMDDTALFQAEELYRDRVNVTVSSFDTEAGGLQQKYREGEFDLVIISHGLPRNLSLSDLFTQISYITAAQGMLILQDKRPDRIADINNGLLNPSWWQSSGDGDHQVSSLLNPDEWLYLLENNGYGDVINLMDQISPELHHYIIVARNRSRSVKQGLHTGDHAQSCYLIACDGSESVQLARLLKTHAIRDGLQLPIVLANGSLSSADDMLNIDLLNDEDQRQLLDMLESRGDVNLKVIYLAATGETQQVSSSLDIGHRISRSNMRLLNLVNILSRADIKSVPSIWVVTSGAASSSIVEELEFNPNPNLAGLWSMGRVIRNEFPDIDLRMIDLQTNATAGHDSHQLWNEINFGDGEEEIILTGHSRKALRIDESKMTTETVDREQLDHVNSIYRLEFNRAGSMDNLEWHERQRSIPTGDEVEIEVRATGLNFRDIMFTSGFLPAEMLEGGMSGASLGLECSGVVSRVGENVDEYDIGDEVIALAPACFSSHVIASRYAVTRKPRDWSFEAAATIPTAFFTVYYSLNYLARMRPGERILIHGAAGGVGLAAIQYANYCGAEIFATAGTPEKRKFLEFLGVDHVLDSRKLQFADQIMAITGNEGVDIVLNSLAGEAMARNFKVLRPFGRFLELGKRDFFENTRMDLKPFRNNITYFGIDADQLLQYEPNLSAKMMREVMQLFNEGIFRPLPYSEYSASEVEKAFRYMQSSQHIGKVIVSQKNQSLNLRREIKKPVLELKSDATYIVTGGLSGFGLATAEWLAERGARHLVLLGRSVNLENDTRRVLKTLTERGINVEVMQCDVTDAIKIQSVLHDINESGFPLKGIFHAAMVLDDMLIRSMNYDAMYKVISPKVQGAWNLHRLTRDYDLDLFVLYSSVTTSIGNPGQANYVAANAFMESLAKFRKRAGLAATVVAWDAINDTGYLARNEDIAGKTTRRLGLGGINTEQAFKALETLIVFGQTETIVFNANWSALKRALPVLNSHLYRNIMHGLEMNESMDGDDLIQLLANTNDSEKQPLVVNFLIAEIARILQMPEEKIAHNCTIQDLGIDSLMAMELATTIEMKLGIGLPVMTLADNVTLDSLANRIINMLNPGDDTARTDSDVDEIVTSLAKIHAEDLTEEELRTISSDIDQHRDDSRRLIK